MEVRGQAVKRTARGVSVVLFLLRSLFWGFQSCADKASRRGWFRMFFWVFQGLVAEAGARSYQHEIA